MRLTSRPPSTKTHDAVVQFTGSRDKQQLDSKMNWNLPERSPLSLMALVELALLPPGALRTWGAKVVITGRRHIEGRKLVREIKGSGGYAAFLRADLGDPAQVRLVLPFTLETFVRLDYAFKNAGYPARIACSSLKPKKTSTTCLP
jgi:hypothetical protein